jgi:hypothetical protein
MKMEGFIKMDVREIGYDMDVTGVETPSSVTIGLASLYRNSNGTEISNKNVSVIRTQNSSLVIAME